MDLEFGIADYSMLIIFITRLLWLLKIIIIKKNLFILNLHFYPVL